MNGAIRIPFIAIMLAVLLGSPGANAQDSAGGVYSELWGRGGEAWKPDGRLPDFSFAGYRRGEEPYRIPAERISVEAFGAGGGDRAVDTAAFKRAIAEGAGKIIDIPAGRYILDDILEIQSSNLVLRGAGPDKTILEFVKPLEEIRPNPANTDGGRPTSGWSWGGGLIAIGGRAAESGPAVRVASGAKRGEKILRLESNPFKPGDEAELVLHDDEDQSLVRYLYRGEPGDASGLRNWRCRQAFRIESADGNTIRLDRPMRYGVRDEWRPTVRPFAPAVTDVGIEGVLFEFPAEPYAGHFAELGYNPVEIGASAAHCWLRDIRVHNADSGPYVRGSFCTLEGIQLTADPERESERGFSGHHGITFYGNDNLCANFSVGTRFIHDLTVQSAAGCAFASGSTEDLCMDHHRWAPHENVFTDLDAGRGTRLFASSGGGNRGHHTAFGATFWNIRAERPAGWPARLGIDSINVVAVQTDDTSILKPNGRWFEAIPPEQIRPANLHRAMLEKRLGKPGFPYAKAE